MRKIIILVSVLFTIVCNSQNTKTNTNNNKTSTTKPLNREQIMKKMKDLDSIQRVLTIKKDSLFIYINDKKVIFTEAQFIKQSIIKFEKDKK